MILPSHPAPLLAASLLLGCGAPPPLAAAAVVATDAAAEDGARLEHRLDVGRSRLGLRNFAWEGGAGGRGAGGLDRAADEVAPREERVEAKERDAASGESKSGKGQGTKSGKRDKAGKSEKSGESESADSGSQNDEPAASKHDHVSTSLVGPASSFQRSLPSYATLNLNANKTNLRTTCASSEARRRPKISTPSRWACRTTSASSAAARSSPR